MNADGNADFNAGADLFFGESLAGFGHVGDGLAVAVVHGAGGFFHDEGFAGGVFVKGAGRGLCGSCGGGAASAISGGCGFLGGGGLGEGDAGAESKGEEGGGELHGVFRLAVFLWLIGPRRATGHH